jgi:hypothetical protein
MSFPCFIERVSFSCIVYKARKQPLNFIGQCHYWGGMGLFGEATWCVSVKNANVNLVNNPSISLHGQCYLWGGAVNCMFDICMPLK